MGPQKAPIPRKAQPRVPRGARTHQAVRARLPAGRIRFEYRDRKAPAKGSFGLLKGLEPHGASAWSRSPAPRPGTTSLCVGFWAQRADGSLELPLLAQEPGRRLTAASRTERKRGGRQGQTPRIPSERAAREGAPSRRPTPSHPLPPQAPPPSPTPSPLSALPQRPEEPIARCPEAPSAGSGL